MDGGMAASYPHLLIDDFSVGMDGGHGGWPPPTTSMFLWLDGGWPPLTKCKLLWVDGGVATFQFCLVGGSVNGGVATVYTLFLVS